ncbi:MAG: hypothetical protein BV456_09620 [Thermoplasmata archaeon M8B2D]|nr:MAG: hypothetical protein BV456_09620 [Thermoplasmata archaeon M8B2D]
MRYTVISVTNDHNEMDVKKFWSYKNAQAYITSSLQVYDTVFFVSKKGTTKYTNKIKRPMGFL